MAMYIFVCLIASVIFTELEGRLALFRQERSWLQSQQTCEHHGGHLAILHQNGSQADVIAEVGLDAADMEAWIGNMKTLEPVNVTQSLPTHLEDMSQYVCGYITPYHVIFHSTGLMGETRVATYTYRVGSESCRLQEDFLCLCHPDEGDLLLVKTGAGSWRDVEMMCKLESRRHGNCRLWQPQTLTTGSMSVSVSAEVLQQYLLVNHTYWIGRVFHLREEDVGATGTLGDLTRKPWSCGLLTSLGLASGDEIQFSRKCNRTLPFICDIDDSVPKETSTTGTDVTYKPQTTLDPDHSDTREGNVSGEAAPLKQQAADKTVTIYVSIFVSLAFIVASVAVVMVLWKVTVSKRSESSMSRKGSSVSRKHLVGRQLSEPSPEALCMQNNRVTIYDQISQTPGNKETGTGHLSYLTVLSDDDQYATIQPSYRIGSNIQPETPCDDVSRDVGTVYDVTSSLKRMRDQEKDVTDIPAVHGGNIYSSMSGLSDGEYHTAMTTSLPRPGNSEYDVVQSHTNAYECVKTTGNVPEPMDARAVGSKYTESQAAPNGMEGQRITIYDQINQTYVQGDEGYAQSDYLTLRGDEQYATVKPSYTNDQDC